MNQRMYQVDAFADQLFEGNPAAVCVLDEWLPDETMQSIAMENNLAETAFLVPRDLGSYDLRWFTPGDEVDLCGHATLASAHTLYQHYGYEGAQISFHTRSGELIVSVIEEGRYLMDFPADHGIAVMDEITLIEKAVGADVLECYKGKDDYMAIVRDQKTLESLKPDYQAIMSLDARGLLITTEGDNHDFVSRCFFPIVAVDEDPVTGSAHTLLTPYWAHRLKKNRLKARQLSARGGDLECIYKGSRVALIGSAVTYMEARINTERHVHSID